MAFSDILTVIIITVIVLLLMFLVLAAAIFNGVVSVADTSIVNSFGNSAVVVIMIVCDKAIVTFILILNRFCYSCCDNDYQFLYLIRVSIPKFMFCSEFYHFIPAIGDFEV